MKTLAFLPSSREARPSAGPFSSSLSAPGLTVLLARSGEAKARILSSFQQGLSPAMRPQTWTSRRRAAGVHRACSGSGSDAGSRAASCRVAWRPSARPKRPPAGDHALRAAPALARRRRGTVASPADRAPARARRPPRGGPGGRTRGARRIAPLFDPAGPRRRERQRIASTPTRALATLLALAGWESCSSASRRRTLARFEHCTARAAERHAA